MVLPGNPNRSDIFKYCSCSILVVYKQMPFMCRNDVRVIHDQPRYQGPQYALLPCTYMGQTKYGDVEGSNVKRKGMMIELIGLKYLCQLIELIFSFLSTCFYNQITDIP